MKRFVAFVFVVLALWLFTGFAQAVEVGGDVQVVLSKDVCLKDSDLDAVYTAQYYDLMVPLKIGDRLTVSPLAGLNYVQLKADGVPYVGDVEADSAIGWNVGAAAQYDLIKQFVDVSLIGKYRFSKSEVDSFDIGGTVYDNPVRTYMSTNEYEVGAIVSKDLKDYNVPITPYVGVVYSDLVGNIKANLGSIDIKEDIEAKDNVGIRFGVKSNPIENITLSIDAKVVDETAIGGRVAIKF